MSEFYEYESSGARCLRSAPIASMMAFVIVLLGGTAFGVGTIYSRKKLLELLDVDHLLPYLDYSVYAIVGATGLFVIIGYIICTVSSGWNAKRCFEGSKKTTCGRCLNVTLLTFLVLAVIFWVLVSALISYPVTSMALLLYRDNGPVRSVTWNRQTRQADFPRPLGVPAPPSTIGEQVIETPITEDPKPVNIQPRVSPGILGNPPQIISNFFKCNEGMIDLSYYGFYDDKGFPLMMPSRILDVKIRNVLAFACVGLFGALLTMFGFLLMTCCVAINYARLMEMRYYDPSDNGDETIRLRH